MCRDHFLFFNYRIFQQLILFLLASILTLKSIAQVTPAIQQQLETNAEQTQAENTVEDTWVDQLMHTAIHPVNLNHTTKEELGALNLLTDIQIFQLLTHLEKNGALLIIYELQSIEGFDLPTIQKLLPYVTISDHPNTLIAPKKLIQEGEHSLILRYAQVLEKQLGFRSIDSAVLFQHPNERFIGSPQKLYFRYRFMYGNSVSWGITAEKDQGELFFKNKPAVRYDWFTQALQEKHRTGFDFYSAHLFIRHVKQLEVLAIGDYQVAFGQGLTVWNAMAFSKSADIGTIKKSGNGIQPYSSVDENKFMRGIAATLQLKKTKITGFYSHKSVDAHVTDSVRAAKPVISSLQQTGSHSTLSEISDKDAVQEIIYGGHVGYSHKRITTGLSFIDNRLHAFLQPAPSATVNDMNLNHTLNIGLDYNCIFYNFNFFGELTHSNNNGIACINGVLASLDPRLSFSLLHRFYKGNYQNNQHAGFAESTGSMERGLYMGAAITFSPTLLLNTYIDRFEFPWLKYQVDAPSAGNDFCIQLNYTPSKKCSIQVRILQRNKEKNTNEKAIINYPVFLKHSGFRFTWSYTVLPSIELKNRVELLYVRQQAIIQNGYLLYQDILYHKPGKSVSATLRYALFQTEGFESRLYAYENDVPGTYSIPAYYDCGSRFYLLLNYSFCKQVECWLRYSQTFYNNKQVISEHTLSEIKGNKKSEIKVQLRFKF